MMRQAATTVTAGALRTAHAGACWHWYLHGCAQCSLRLRQFPPLAETSSAPCEPVSCPSSQTPPCAFAVGMSCIITGQPYSSCSDFREGLAASTCIQTCFLSDSGPTTPHSLPCYIAQGRSASALKISRHQRRASKHDSVVISLCKWCPE